MGIYIYINITKIIITIIIIITIAIITIIILIIDHGYNDNNLSIDITHYDNLSIIIDQVLLLLLSILPPKMAALIIQFIAIATLSVHWCHSFDPYPNGSLEATR